MKKINNVSPNSPTKDEAFVKNYLDSRGIRYKAEYRIDNLKGDLKYSYRVVDFYLVNLGTYVEYYGLYNATRKIRAEYDLKTKVYIENNLPTIIIYPHELGYLDFAFHFKLLKLLRIKKFHSTSKILRYKFNRYLTIGKSYVFFIAIACFIIGIQSLIQSIDNYDLFFTIYLIGMAFSVALMGYFLRNLYLVMVRDY
ncbi:hypothetical protein [Winogradskyella vincentii]|uniref:DUF2812 domain-containing protein n=1 Tax=Winogradskyella vincentii TaxID=2877122 RepID=A0ABS7XWR1_9FLAO|nr:hypothetical protein [Winogradskyella vincentii]MCA0152094.1 hypothetical protein [Winogradskyella vincentii]